MSQQPLVATWTSHTALASSASACVTTKSAVADKTHYILGFAASADFWFAGASSSYPPESVEVTLSHGAAGLPTIITQMTFTGTTGWADTSYNYSAGGGGGPLVVNFPAPIMVPENVDVNLKIDCLGSTTSVNQDANIWGFTATTRISFE